jgi:hypothetical protein
MRLVSPVVHVGGAHVSGAHVSGAHGMSPTARALLALEAIQNAPGITWLEREMAVDP